MGVELTPAAQMKLHIFIQIITWLYVLLYTTIDIGKGLVKDVTPETLGHHLLILHVLSLMWCLIWFLLAVLMGLVLRLSDKAIEIYVNFTLPGFIILVVYWLYNWYMMKTKIQGSLF